LLTLIVFVTPGPAKIRKGRGGERRAMPVRPTGLQGSMWRVARATSVRQGRPAWGTSTCSISTMPSEAPLAP
jgi:hypothetical protein